MLRFSNYLISSLKYYWRTNLGVIAGAAVATAVLVGALISGDSVKFSLLNLSMKRLGGTQFALESERHNFRAELAEEIGASSRAVTSGMLHLSGSLQKGGNSRLNHIQVYGVDENFKAFALSNDFPGGIENNSIAINTRIARLLELSIGDQLILQVEKNSTIPLETPVASKADRIATIPVTIAAILDDRQLGRFSLRSNQIEPNNLFMDISYLSGKLGVLPRNNIILCQLPPGSNSESLEEALKENITLEDMNLTLRDVPASRQLELISEEIFLNHALVDKASSVMDSVDGVLGYFVNEIRSGASSVPYSFAVGLSKLGSEYISPNEIILNKWAAKQLNSAIGDSVLLNYFIVDPENQLVEQSQPFLLKDIVVMEGLAADRTLMPDFPGLGDAETCSDWQPGIPIELDKIGVLDEFYWEQYGGTPKAFISLTKAQEIWGNKHGDLTALRFSSQRLTHRKLSQKLLEAIPPGSEGLTFKPVLKDAISASAASVDFGQLFIGMSFFIIIAANLLTGLLFVLNTEQRSNETNQLLALGYLPEQIRSIRLTEGLLLAGIGGLIGAFVGIQYSRLILYGLGSFWRDAVGFSDFYQLVIPWKIFVGVVAGFGVSALAIWLAIRKQLIGLSISELPKPEKDVNVWRRKRKKHLIILSILTIMALAILGKHYGSQTNAVAKFFTAAGLLLIVGLQLCHVFINEAKNSLRDTPFKLKRIILGNWGRRSGKNMAIISLLASGVFIVVSVGLNHHDAGIGSENKGSGTGGFELFIETTLPIIETDKIIHDSNTPGATSEYVRFRMKTGDDGSCLNLNMVSQPQLLGVQADDLSRRFTFHKSLELGTGEMGWKMLDHEFEAGVIPAIADMSVIQWGLGLSLGDTLYYTDDFANELKLVLVGGLANSVFQGNVLISDRNFAEYFASISGYQLILLDVDDPVKSQQHLEVTLKSFGPAISGTSDRLKSFAAVENTYLTIFLMLGGLGLFIGTFGLGAVLLRNVLEDRQELAVLRAIGFSKSRLFTIILSEQILNLFFGLLVGGIAALVSILPIISSGDSGSSIKLVTGLIGVLLVNGLLWVILAVRSSFRTDVVTQLTEE